MQGVELLRLFLTTSKFKFKAADRPNEDEVEERPSDSVPSSSFHWRLVFWPDSCSDQDIDHILRVLAFQISNQSHLKEISKLLT